MRDPITKFPQRPTGVAQSRRTLVEIQTVLKNPRLSPEMRTSLEQRVTALRSEIADGSAPRGREGSSSSAAPSDSRDK
jgi:uncharacterized small protein (DUF1192 family)